MIRGELEFGNGFSEAWTRGGATKCAGAGLNVRNSAQTDDESVTGKDIVFYDGKVMTRRQCYARRHKGVTFTFTKKELAQFKIKPAVVQPHLERHSAGIKDTVVFVDGQYIDESYVDMRANTYDPVILTEKQHRGRERYQRRKARAEQAKLIKESMLSPELKQITETALMEAIGTVEPFPTNGHRNGSLYFHRQLLKEAAEPIITGSSSEERVIAAEPV